MHATDRDPRHWEEDHAIPLELGGHPTSEQNLWPQPIAEARLKDGVENWLHGQVCQHGMPLKQAQADVLAWEPICRRERLGC